MIEFAHTLRKRYSRGGCQIYSIAVLLFLFLAHDAVAQILVDRSVIHWKPTMPPVLNVTIRNRSDYSILVENQATRVENPGTPDEKSYPSNDIVITPKKVSVAGKSDRFVRLLFRGKRTDVEQVYRVAFSPRKTEEPMVPKEGERRAEIRILTGMGSLIFVQPIVVKPKLRWERSGENIVFYNEGNINAQVGKAEVCPAAGGGCTKPVAKRIHPGKTWSIPVPMGHKLRFVKRMGDESTVHEVE